MFLCSELWLMRRQTKCVSLAGRLRRGRWTSCMRNVPRGIFPVRRWNKAGKEGAGRRRSPPFAPIRGNRIGGWCCPTRRRRELRRARPNACWPNPWTPSRRAAPSSLVLRRGVISRPRKCNLHDALPIVPGFPFLFSLPRKGIPS